MNNDPRYAPVAAALPAILPPISRINALIVYKRLVTAFGRITDIPVGVLERRNGRPITSGRTRARFGWASSKPTTGSARGWGRIIHDASHYVFEQRHPSARPHDGGHAVLEREMAAYIGARPHWLVAYGPPPAKRRPSYAERIQHTRYLMDKWERKGKRVQTAVRKLARRLRALERAQAKLTRVSGHESIAA